MKKKAINFKRKSIRPEIFFEKLLKVNYKFPYVGERLPSLKNFVYAMLGLPLVKDQTMSNWENRTLRQSQRIYAALDAHCLLKLHKAMEEVMLTDQFEEWMEECTSGPSLTTTLIAPEKGIHGMPGYGTSRSARKKRNKLARDNADFNFDRFFWD